MCDVPSTAVFCSESIECFPGIPTKFFLKPFVAMPVAPIITGIIIYFRFHVVVVVVVIIIIIIIISSSSSIKVCVCVCVSVSECVVQIGAQTDFSASTSVFP
jgi:hypothetical protein